MIAEEFEDAFADVPADVLIEEEVFEETAEKAESEGVSGHSTFQMTMDLYTHVRDKTLKEELGLLAEMA